MRESAPTKRRPLVVLSGPYDLVLECSTKLSASGYDLCVFDPSRGKRAANLPDQVRVSSSIDVTASIALELTLTPGPEKQERVRALDRTLPPETLILSNSLVTTVAEQISWIVGKHRLLGIGVLPTFFERPVIELAPSAMTPSQTIDAARTLFASTGTNVEVVQDRAGLVAARVICQLINEAAFASQDDVASPQDIDTSMKLGVSYPLGPFEWADKLGVGNVVAVLQALQTEYQEERYRVSPLLRSLALGGPWWHRTSEEQSKVVGS